MSVSVPLIESIFTFSQDNKTSSNPTKIELIGELIFAHLSHKDLYETILVSKSWKQLSLKTAQERLYYLEKVWKVWMRVISQVEAHLYNLALETSYRDALTKVHQSAFKMSCSSLNQDDQAIFALTNYWVYRSNENPIWKEVILKIAEQNTYFQESIPSPIKEPFAWSVLDITQLFLKWKRAREIDSSLLNLTQEVVYKLCECQQYSTVYRLLKYITHHSFQEIAKSILVTELVCEPEQRERAQAIAKTISTPKLMLDAIERLLLLKPKEALILSSYFQSPLKEVFLGIVFRSCVKYHQMETAVEAFNEIPDISMLESLEVLKRQEQIAIDDNDQNKVKKLQAIAQKMIKDQLTLKLVCYKQLIEPLIKYGEIHLVKKVNFHLEIESNEWSTFSSIVRSLYRAIKQSENVGLSIEVIKLLSINSDTLSVLLQRIINVLMQYKQTNLENPKIAVKLALMLPFEHTKSKALIELIENYWLAANWEVAYELIHHCKSHNFNNSHDTLVEAIYEKACISKKFNRKALLKIADLIADEDKHQKVLKKIAKSKY